MQMRVQAAAMKGAGKRARWRATEMLHVCCQGAHTHLLRLADAQLLGHNDIELLQNEGLADAGAGGKVQQQHQALPEELHVAAKPHLLPRQAAGVRQCGQRLSLAPACVCMCACAEPRYCAAGGGRIQ